MNRKEYIEAQIRRIKRAQKNEKMRVRKFANTIGGMTADQVMAEFDLIQKKRSKLSYSERLFIHRLCIEALMAEARAKKEADKKAEIETETVQEVVN